MLHVAEFEGFVVAEIFSGTRAMSSNSRSDEDGISSPDEMSSRVGFVTYENRVSRPAACAR
jgi:hypothetical protein